MKQAELNEAQEQRKQNEEYEQEMARRKIQQRLQFQHDLNQQIQCKHSEEVVGLALFSLLSFFI